MFVNGKHLFQSGKSEEIWIFIEERKGNITTIISLRVATVPKLSHNCTVTPTSVHFAKHGTISPLIVLASKKL